MTGTWDFPAVARLAATGLFSPVELYLAGYGCRVQERDHETLALAAALAASHAAQGHGCLDLARPGSDWTRALAEAGLEVPPIGAWREDLAACAVVGAPGEYAPLILDGTRLYLERLHRAETALAQDLLERAGNDFFSSRISLDRAAQVLNRVFPESRQGDGPNWQKVAAFAALRRGLTVVAGGPGTGKTHTVAGILACIAELETPLLGRAPRMALAAPTGKAAARLAESLSRTLDRIVDRLDIPGEIRGDLPREAATIHRLLGAGRSGGGFFHGPDKLLDLDLLVVDEASMVDQRLCNALVQALPTTARLVLLGDQDQLSSVEPGYVMHDICWGAGLGFSDGFAHDLARMDPNIPPVPLASAAAPLVDCIVELQHSYRFDADQEIGVVSRAVRNGDAQETLRVVMGSTGQVGWLELAPGRASLHSLAPLVREGYADLTSARTPQEALAAMERFRVLTPLRRGDRGVAGLNGLAARWLHSSGHVPVARVQPIMIRRNHAPLGLYNGDAGVLMRGPDADVRAWFPAMGPEMSLDSAQGGETGPRRFAPARLPEHEPVHAMTVHKSQGSEFDSVLLVLPESPVSGLGRELVYTALTRAKERIVIAGSPQVLAHAVAHRVERTTGLGERLWGADAGVAGDVEE